jgi:hypothetical protein
LQQWTSSTEEVSLAVTFTMAEAFLKPGGMLIGRVSTFYLAKKPHHLIWNSWPNSKKSGWYTLECWRVELNFVGKNTQNKRLTGVIFLKVQIH